MIRMSRIECFERKQKMKAPNNTNWKSQLKAFALVLAFGLPTASAFGQYKVLHVFTGGDDGGNPYDSLIASGTTLYGTTGRGGEDGYGTVFSIQTDGKEFSILQPFTGLYNSAGAYPYASLLLDGDTLIGTAIGGGDDDGPLPGGGSVFTLQTDGTGLEAVHSFNNPNGGMAPSGTLIQSDDILYGTTIAGGDDGNTFGSVFALNMSDGQLTYLFGFPQSVPDDPAPDGVAPTAGLTLSGSTLYGTTSGGSIAINGIFTEVYGNIFSLSTDGQNFNILHTFTTPKPDKQGLDTNYDGTFPTCVLVLSGDKLYGTAANGGNYGWGTLFSVNTDGTGFTVLHQFNGKTDGGMPLAGLLLSGNTLYGVTEAYGANKYGTLFSMNIDGKSFKVLHSFSGGKNGVDGAYPHATPVLVGNTLYGTTFGDKGGGKQGFGVVYSYKLP
jgi:uncharacterized repeat protein (TIGR03803 family)